METATNVLRRSWWTPLRSSHKEQGCVRLWTEGPEEPVTALSPLKRSLLIYLLRSTDEGWRRASSMEANDCGALLFS